MGDESSLNQMKEPRPKSRRPVQLIAVIAAVLILFGLDRSVQVEVYGLSLSPAVVAIALYLLGALAGWASQSVRR